MDEIRSLQVGEEKLYNMKIYSDSLLKLIRDCPDDGHLMRATGLMYFNARISRWSVEYMCTKDKEVYNIGARDTDALTKQIAKDVLEKKNEDISSESD